MKKLFVLATLGIMAVLTFGMIGTGAWFTDTATVGDNWVQTGSLDLLVEKRGEWKVSNLEPGGDYRVLGIFCAYNVGNYDMKWRGYIKVLEDNKGLQHHLQVRAIANPLEAQGTHGPQNVAVFTDVPFTTLTGWTNYILDADPIHKFNPGEEICERVEVRLLPSANNSHQNAIIIADLVINATQAINPGWGE